MVLVSRPLPLFLQWQIVRLLLDLEELIDLLHSLTIAVRIAIQVEEATFQAGSCKFFSGGNVPVLQVFVGDSAERRISG